MSAATGASDATYHRRHSRRSRRRAERIAEHIDGPVSALDVGCNIGITGSYLLETGVATHVTGIELSAATVDEALKKDDRFELIEGDVTEVEPPANYDVVVYGAVHHHVLNYHGLDAAVSVLQKLADHADRQLFFETGHLAEGGRWPWQRAMRRYFASDEEHLHYLLSCIEHCMQDFAVIGRYRIHGARRAYLRVDLKPRADRPRAIAAPVVPLTMTAGSGMGRTFGSRDQRLLPASDAAASVSPTWFGHATSEDGAALFLKRHRHRPLAGHKEYALGEQLRADWAVRPVGVADDGQTLVFPRVEGQSLASLASAPAAQRRQVAAQLRRIFAEASRTAVDFPPHRLLRMQTGASLLDACDLHGNNFLVCVDEAAPKLRFVDFEHHGVSCRPRNDLHLSRCLWELRTHRLHALVLFLRGMAGTCAQLVRNELRDLDDRVRDRRPGLLSLVGVRVRSLSGRAFGSLLRLAGIE